jgi:hypothetical protein
MRRIVSPARALEAPGKICVIGSNRAKRLRLHAGEARVDDAQGDTTARGCAAPRQSVTIGFRPIDDRPAVLVQMVLTQHA